MLSFVLSGFPSSYLTTRCVSTSVPVEVLRRPWSVLNASVPGNWEVALHAVELQCCCPPSVLSVTVIPPAVTCSLGAYAAGLAAGPQAPWDLPLGVGRRAQHQPVGCVQTQRLWLCTLVSLRTCTDF